MKSERASIMLSCVETCPIEALIDRSDAWTRRYDGLTGHAEASGRGELNTGSGMPGLPFHPGTRRTRLAAISTVMMVILAGSVWHFARRDIHPLPSRVPPLRPAAMKILPGISMLGGLALSAAYVVETSEGLVLIDSGLDHDAGPLKSELAELGLNWRDLRAILITHVHGDHCGGADWLRAATGARVYAGEGDAAILRAGVPHDAFFSIFNMPHDIPCPTSVDQALKGGEILTFGDVQIQCIATPGHTPGSICYLLEHNGLRAIFLGDVLMMLAGDENPVSELRKPVGTYSSYLPPHYRGNASDMLDSLQLPRDEGSRPGAAGSSRFGSRTTKPLPLSRSLGIFDRRGDFMTWNCCCRGSRPMERISWTVFPSGCCQT